MKRVLSSFTVCLNVMDTNQKLQTKGTSRSESKLRLYISQSRVLLWVWGPAHTPTVLSVEGEVYQYGCEIEEFFTCDQVCPISYIFPQEPYRTVLLWIPEIN